MIQPAPVHRDGQLTHGFWGNHTSTIDWCEGNYVHSWFIAETYNTLSNIPFIVLAVVGAISVLRPAKLSKPLPHARRFVLMHALLALVGAGSFVFHATLKWRAQVMFDEMPMLLVTCAALYSIRVPIRPETLGTIILARKPGTATVAKLEDHHFWLRLRWQIGTPLFALLTCIAYLRLPHPLIHQFTFAFLMCCNAAIVFGLLTHPNLRVPLSPVPKSSKSDSASPSATPTAGAVAFRTLGAGLAIFLSGFAIWIADNLLCDSLSNIRSMAIGRDAGIIGVLTQGHAWWHLLTGLGANWLIVGLTYLRLAVTDPLAFEIAHYWGVVPYVRWRQQIQAPTKAPFATIATWPHVTVGCVVFAHHDPMDDLYSDYDPKSLSGRMDKSFGADYTRRITLPLPDDLQTSFPPGLPKYDPSSMPYPTFYDFKLKPTYVPPFSYYILRALQPHYASISPLEELLSSQVSVGATRVNIVDSLLPHAKHDMDYVDPPTWAILIQIFDDLPQRCFKYTLALNDPHLSTLATIPSTPNFSVVTFLDLSCCDELQDGNIGFLKGLTSLCVFDASRTRLTDQGVKNFKSTLFLREPGPAYLRSWSLRECEGVTAKALGSLLAFPLLCVLDLRETSVRPSQLKAAFWPQSTLLPVLENVEYFAPYPQHKIPELLQQLEKSSFLHSQNDTKAKAPYVIHVDRVRPESHGYRSSRGSGGVSRIANNVYHVSSTYVQPSDREERNWPRYERPPYYPENEYDDDCHSYFGSEELCDGWPSGDERSSDSEDLQSMDEGGSDDDLSDTSSSEASLNPAKPQGAPPLTYQEPMPSSPISTRTIQSSSSPAPVLLADDSPSERPATLPTRQDELPQTGTLAAGPDGQGNSPGTQGSPRPTPNRRSTEDILEYSDSDSSDAFLDDALDRESRNITQTIPGFFNSYAQAGLAPPKRKRPRLYSSESSRSYDSEEERKKQRTDLSSLGDVELLLIRRPPPWSTVQKLVVAKQKTKASAELQSWGQGSAGRSEISSTQLAQKKVIPDGAKTVWNLIRASSSKKPTLPSSSAGPSVGARRRR